MNNGLKVWPVLHRNCLGAFESDPLIDILHLTQEVGMQAPQSASIGGWFTENPISSP